MSIKYFMNKEVVSIDKSSSILDACKLMKKENVGFLLVTDNLNLAGVITDRDITTYLADGSLNHKIEHAMTKSVETINVNSYPEDVSDLMGYKQIKRLVVVDDLENVVGVIGVSDLVRDEFTSHLALEALKEIYFEYKKTYIPPQQALKVDDFPL